MSNVVDLKTGAPHVAGSDLTKGQAQAAAALRAKRPPTYPGTDIITEPRGAEAWYVEIAEIGAALDIKSVQFANWCNACGVIEGE